ncbi:alpha/beta hydrolase [Simiduia agarivorans SA1 = DSM 21679]|uniref:Alpha/beta hydrolase n=2 Tax=Simiduia TaxID=447467 RepID=K4KJT6_SIMAS|nr:alpha/beta hydrolase [Simiduia agarivorans SA1 = DSM 21679]
MAFAALSLTSIGAPASALEKTDCHLRGLPDKAECFSLIRPEDPANPNGKTFNLHAARVPALTPSKAEPLVFLAGGPGQSAIEVGGMVTQALRPLLADRDLVFLEQRGTGDSNGFNCVTDDEDPYADLFAEADLEAMTRACLDAFDGDPQHYNTPNAIDDFAAMVQALGYDKVHVYGGSYGTRAALVFMRAHPQLIRSVILDSMAPVQTVVGPFANHGHRALTLLFDECEANPGCNTTHPQLRDNFWALWARAGEAPIDVTVTHPTTFAPQRLRLDQTKLFHLVINFLYSQQQRQLLPVAIDAAADNNFAPLAGLMAAVSGGQGLYHGLTTNIVCNEDIRRQAPAAEETRTPFGDVSLSMWQRMCEHWPAYRLDDAHFEPVASDLPVLALSGRLDPVTPPAWGEETVASLSNAQHLVADNAAHIVGLKGCGPKLIQAFLRAPGAPLDNADCLAELPGVHFMLNQNNH